LKHLEPVLHQLQVQMQVCKQLSTPPDCYDEQTFQHTVLLVFLAVEVSQAVESILTSEVVEAA